MEKYKYLHLWMIIPMVLMQLGIYKDYWGDFSQNNWAVHIHYWTGTIWYFYLILQPYYATHGQLTRHRTNGIIGMFLGGGVSITALSMLHRDMVVAQRSLENPERFGPFEPWFFYGVAAVEIVMITAFAYAIIKAIIHRKSLEDHAWWLMSTVFIIMMPALARGIQNVHVGMQRAHWPNVDIMSSLYLTQAIIIALVLLAAWKFDKLRHPATWLAVGVNVYTCFLEPIGKTGWVQQILVSVVKP